MVITVKMNRCDVISFDGVCMANVTALNHDDSVRRIFRLYKTETDFVAERIDDPTTIDVRFWGARCKDTDSIYEFFGNEPLANYLYGSLQLAVPGLCHSSTA